MQTEINLSSITNGKVVTAGGVTEWKGTGVFDKLIEVVNKNIKIQYDEGKIKGTEYANVYLGSMQAVLQQSVEYILKEKLIEVQIQNELKNLELKEEQLALAVEQRKISYVERVAKDKEAAKLGMDLVMKNTNVMPDAVYVPKYKQ